MSLKAGIVGLPNIGKSTLFNAITNSNAIAENYPFATIEPNKGITPIKSSRLDFLSAKFKPRKTIPTFVEFVDIAGLVKGASKGEGLGNAFLSHIRNIDLICMLVRCFENQDIIHVDKTIEPIRDIETINLELLLSDQELITNRKNKIHKKAINAKGSKLLTEISVLEQALKVIEKGTLLNKINWSDQDLFYLKQMNLLTLKPFYIIGNIEDDDLKEDPDCFNYKHIKNLKDYAKTNNWPILFMSVQLEEDLSKLDNENKKIFLDEFDLQESRLDLFIKKVYHYLHLKTFFTAGPVEVRAWTFVENNTAPQCAGIIHTDFERHFIKAQIYKFENFKKYPSEILLKKHGLIKLEGKNYIMQDGDVCFFKTSA